MGDRVASRLLCRDGREGLLGGLLLGLVLFAAVPEVSAAEEAAAAEAAAAEGSAEHDAPATAEADSFDELPWTEADEAEAADAADPSVGTAEAASAEETQPDAASAQPPPQQAEAAEAEAPATEGSAVDELLMAQAPPADESTQETPPAAPVDTIAVQQDEPAPAPEAKAPPKRRMLEEIVVTAQKREETLSKIPLAVSAFDQKAMEKVGSNSLSNGVSLVPNMQNSVGGIAIRGVGSSSLRSTAPTVAMHVDGVYTDDDPRGMGMTWDLARVEVLRGPQGTLYGRNATAGVVNYITAKPSNEFEVFGDLSYRDGNEKMARFVVNQPLAEGFAVRLAGGTVQSDGLQRNRDPRESDGGAMDTIFTRLSARWMPADALVWDASFEYNRDDSIGCCRVVDWYVSKPNRRTAIVYPARMPKDVTPPQGPGASMFGDFEDRNSGVVESYKLRSNLRYDFNERWALSSITGYAHSETRANNNGLPLALLDRSLRGNDSEGRSDALSQELDLHFDGTGLRGVAGLYYYQKESFDENIVHIWTPSGSSGPQSPPQLNQAIDLANQTFEPSYDESYAAFGQLTVDVTEAFRLTGGLRYTRDSSELGAGVSKFCQFGEFRDPDQPISNNCRLLDASGAFGGVFGVNNLPNAKRDWSAVSWKVIGDYDFNPDLLGYATVSTGYKQGAISDRSDTRISTIEPETNTNYELGLRAQLFENTATLNITAFWMNYVDLQVSTSATVNGAPALTFANVGKARIRGVETEWSWRFTDADRIDGYVTYLDATITHWPDAPDPFRGPDFTFDAAGNEPSAAPKSTFRLAYTHDFDLGRWGRLAPTLSTYYASEAYAHYTNGPQDRIPSYWRSDAFVRYDAANDRVWVEAFVNNIEDHQTKGSVSMFTTEASDTGPGGGIQWAFYSPGRVAGLRVGARF